MTITGGEVTRYISWDWESNMGSWEESRTVLIPSDFLLHAKVGGPRGISNARGAYHDMAIRYGDQARLRIAKMEKKKKRVTGRKLARRERDE